MGMDKGKYKQGREAGLKWNELRNLTETYKTQPEKRGIIESIFSDFAEGLKGIFSDVGQAASGIVEDVAEAAQDIVEGVADAVENILPGSPAATPTSKGAAKSGGSSGGGSGGSSKGGGGGKKGGPPGTYGNNFTRFAKAQMKKNPGISSKELEKQFRAKGGKIGHKGAQAAVREIKGQPEKTPSKITKFTETINGKQYSGSIRKGMKYFGPERNPQAKTYIKGRYTYYVKYQVEREGFAEPSTEYISISSNRMLTQDEVEAAVEKAIGEGEESAKDQMNEARANGKKISARMQHRIDKYKNEGLVEGSVQILYAVDMKAK